MIFSKIRAVAAFPPAERRAAAEALLLPLAIAAGFRLWGVAKTQAALRRWSATPQAPSTNTPSTNAPSTDAPSTDAPSTDAPAAIRAARLAQQRAFFHAGIGGSCLVRSLTLWTMLRRRGVEADLRVGVRRSGQSIEGHAWIEYEGLPLNEHPAIVETYALYDKPLSFDAFESLHR